MEKDSRKDKPERKSPDSIGQSNGVFSVMTEDGYFALRGARQESLQASQILFIPFRPRFDFQNHAGPAGLDHKIHLVPPLGLFPQYIRLSKKT
jgi:hypothetical protein